jgi:hypothetical protein
MSDSAKEILYDRLDPTLRLTPGPAHRPARWRLVSRRGAPEFQRRPLDVRTR